MNRHVKLVLVDRHVLMESRPPAVGVAGVMLTLPPALLVHLGTPALLA